MPAAFQPFVRTPDVPKPQNFSEFLRQVDAALEGAPSKSKARSGMKNLSDNDAITASNAYSAGVRDPQQVIQAILEKRKARQGVHVDEYYRNKREVPE